MGENLLDIIVNTALGRRQLMLSIPVTVADCKHDAGNGFVELPRLTFVQIQPQFMIHLQMLVLSWCTLVKVASGTEVTRIESHSKPVCLTCYLFVQQNNCSASNTFVLDFTPGSILAFS